MTAPLLVYASTTAFAAVLCLWTAAQAARGASSYSRIQRLASGVAAIGVLLATAASVFATSLGAPRLVWATALLPALILTATWSNTLTLGRCSPTLRLLAAPILVHNLLLMGVYSAQVAQECMGLDLGTWGCALAGADAHLQAWTAEPNALHNPVWLRLPIVLPLWNKTRTIQLSSLLTATVYSGAFMVAFGLVMPHSYRRAESYHESQPIEVRKETPMGARVPWGQGYLSEGRLARIRSHVQRLACGFVTFEVGPSTFADPSQLTQVQGEVAWARAQGVTAIAITRPPSHRRSDLSLADLRRAMEQTQWDTAKKIRPHAIVLFASPFDRLAPLLDVPPNADQWSAAIAKSAQEIREADDSIQLAVSLENTQAHGEALLSRLRASDSPLDFVGLSLFATNADLSHFGADLTRLSTAYEAGPTDRPVIVLEVKCSPRANGGEPGQWNFISRAIDFADSTDSVEGICIGAIYDLDEDVALISWAGRRRLSYRMLRASPIK